ncbi:MAG: type II toxin-antitoxin system RelE/ParE family toxin [Bacteroidota bacterium]
MKLEWTEIALDDYDNCIHYLENEFTEKEILSFILTMENCLDLIKKNPNSFPKSDYKNIRYILVIPQVSIYYTTSNNLIQIVRVWNNRMNKKNLIKKSKK